MIFVRLDLCVIIKNTNEYQHCQFKPINISALMHKAHASSSGQHVAEACIRIAIADYMRPVCKSIHRILRARTLLAMTMKSDYEAAGAKRPESNTAQLLCVWLERKAVKDTTILRTTPLLHLAGGKRIFAHFCDE